MPRRQMTEQERQIWNVAYATRFAETWDGLDLSYLIRADVTVEERDTAMRAFAHATAEQAGLAADWAVIGLQRVRATIIPDAGLNVGTP